MIRRIGIIYHVRAVVLVDGMDKLHDVMGGVGEVGDWRVCVQTHSMELITVLNVKRKITLRQLPGTYTVESFKVMRANYRYPVLKFFFTFSWGHNLLDSFFLIVDQVDIQYCKFLI